MLLTASYRRRAEGNTAFTLMWYVNEVRSYLRPIFSAAHSRPQAPLWPPYCDSVCRTDCRGVRPHAMCGSRVVFVAIVVARLRTVSSILGSVVTLSSTACTVATGPLSVAEITVTSASYNLARAAIATATTAYAATPASLANDGVVDQAYPALTAPGDFWSASSVCASLAPQTLTLTLPWKAAITMVRHAHDPTILVIKC